MIKRLLLIPFILCTLTGCGGNTGFADKIELYSDLAVAKNGNLEFSFSSISEDLDNSFVSFTMDLVNRDKTPYTFIIEESKIIFESYEVEFEVGGYTSNQIELPRDVSKSINFGVYIPTSIEDDKYTFRLKYNSKEIILHLYETPDEERKLIDVTFVADGRTVAVKKIHERKLLLDNIWVSSDYHDSCKDWYFDRSYTTKVDKAYRVTEPITVYGKRERILQYCGVDGNVFVCGCYYIPTNGEIVIPRWRDVYYHPVIGIRSGSFSSECYGLKKLYIHKNVKIVADDFSQCKDLRYIYFEGTEEEWAGVKHHVSFDSKVKIVFNTYK